MHGERLPQRWLVIDTVDPHLGEEPACRFFCDPRRPAMTIVRPGGELIDCEIWGISADGWRERWSGGE